MRGRIILSVIILFCILFLPFWVSVVFGLFGVIYFSYFFEVVFLFLLSDLLYGVGEVRYLQVTFVSFAIALGVLLLAEFLKKKFK